MPNRALFLVAVALAGCGLTAHGDGEDPAAVLFSGDRVETFELALPVAALAGLAARPFDYQEGTLTWNGQRFERVGVRLKGRASFRTIDGKAAFKVKLDEFVPRQRLLGLRRLTFNNDVQDPSFARERLAYHLYRAAGVPAPRAASARLLVNGQSWGLYTHVETLDDEFVERRFGKPLGNLYDTSNTRYFVDLRPADLPLFERETTGTPADGSDLPRLVQGLAGPDGSFVDDASTVIDLDQFLGAAAVEAVIADWDGYFGAANNYEVYHHPARGRFAVLPWGKDQTFGKRGEEVLTADYAIDQSGSRRPRGLVLDRCLRVPACHARYLDAIDRVLAVWDRAGLAAELEAIAAQVAPLAGEGRSPPSEAQRRMWTEQLRGFLAGRAAAVRAQVQRARAALPR